MIRTRLGGAALLLACCSPLASAQLQLTLLSSFTDQLVAGGLGYGCIGITQDEVVGNIYIVDFATTQGLHEFDSVGNYLGQFSTVGCTPSSVSPNDVTWSPHTDTLWLVDNNGSIVLNTSRGGTCLGGFYLPSGLLNTVGITYERATKTLFVSSTGQVTHYDLLGNTLPGGFQFTPPFGSSILSGITHMPKTGNFLITQSSGSSIFEVSPTGTLISTISLSPWGITNTQGLHFNPNLGTLLVIDNTQSTAFIFSAGCIPAQPYGAGCPGAGGFIPSLQMSGCPEAGKQVTLNLVQGLGGAMSALLISVGQASTPLGGNCTLLVAATPFSLLIPLGGTGPGGGSYSLPGLIPVGTPTGTVYLQAFVGDPAGAIGMSASNGLKVDIQ